MGPSNRLVSFSSYAVVGLFACSVVVCSYTSDPPLTLDYYLSSCPTAFDIITKEMECAVSYDPRNAALIVQLLFHDCFVQPSVLRLLALNIVRGSTEARSNNIWASFVVEASKGFHRIDIFWPLMQLLQRKRNPSSAIA